MTFATAEQFTMYSKARVLNDNGMAYEMLNTPENHSGEHKKMGIIVKNLDVNIWTSKCVDIVITGNMQKFTRDSNLVKKLIKIGDRVLIEASLYYSIWGIGFNENEALMNLENWGENKPCNEHEYCVGS
ncbi:hypothetical protein AUP68_06489 [Ilyonectria robusta]